MRKGRWFSGHPSPPNTTTPATEPRWEPITGVLLMLPCPTLKATEQKPSGCPIFSPLLLYLLHYTLPAGTHWKNYTPYSRKNSLQHQRAEAKKTNKTTLLPAWHQFCQSVRVSVVLLRFRQDQPPSPPPTNAKLYSLQVPRVAPQAPRPRLRAPPRHRAAGAGAERRGSVFSERRRRRLGRAAARRCCCGWRRKIDALPSNAGIFQATVESCHCL